MAESRNDKQKYSTALENYNKAYNTDIQLLKPLQTEALNMLLAGKDCVCCLPTGYGKSLIFEILPFIDTNSLVIIVEPLNVIILQECKKLGDKAVCLASNTDLSLVKDGKISYIFCHPEDIVNSKDIIDLFRCEEMKKKKIYFVIDEAHCILEWGDEFRPSYKKLGNMRSVFVCSVLALSATVTCVGQKHIMKNLKLNDCKCICATPTRENIELIVLKRPSASSKGNSASTPYEYIFKRVLDDLVDLGDQFPVTVIYCKAMQWIGYGYQLAREILGDKFYAGEPSPETARVVMFHSSMEGSGGELKQMILAYLQKSPDQCSLRLVFASVALGMGADLRHVERVIHAGPPSTLETYIQEVGRCGRTGTRAHAILYYNNSDLANQHMQASMKDFCKSEQCKRELINEHFGFIKSERPTICCNICQTDLGLQWDFSHLSIK